MQSDGHTELGRLGLHLPEKYLFFSKHLKISWPWTTSYLNKLKFLILKKSKFEFDLPNVLFGPVILPCRVPFPVVKCYSCEQHAQRDERFLTNPLLPLWPYKNDLLSQNLIFPSVKFIIWVFPIFETIMRIKLKVEKYIKNLNSPWHTRYTKKKKK